MDFKKILFKSSEIDVEKALPDGVILCDKSGKIHWVNDRAAELFATSKMHLMTSNISDIIENVLNLVTNAVIYNKEVIAKMVAAETYFTMTAKDTEEGYVLAFRAVEKLNNIKETKTTTEPKSISKDKNLFLIKLANDFKSPLQSIVGFSQAMADGLGGNISEQQEKYIRIIKKNSSDLMYFTDKLMELSRTEASLNNPDYKTFDIINLINSVVRYNEQLTKDKDLRWNVNIAEGFKNTVVSDENMIKAIIQNILEVILRSVEMGELSISIFVPDEDLLHSKGLPNIDYFAVSITSSSLLLSENDLESMFDPYKIVDSSNRKNLLRAMILACVSNYIQALRGVIWVESKILKNTEFNILIPNGKR